MELRARDEVFSSSLVVKVIFLPFSSDLQERICSLSGFRSCHYLKNVLWFPQGNLWYKSWWFGEQLNLFSRLTFLRFAAQCQINAFWLGKVCVCQIRWMSLGFSRIQKLGFHKFGEVARILLLRHLEQRILSQ